MIETGDDIIHKELELGAASLSPVEKAIYDLWAVDYAVRNAGDMEALEDLRPTAAADLAAFLRSSGQSNLAMHMEQLAGAGEECGSYYESFPRLRRALKSALSGT